jgi:hypothetical protein
LKSAVSYFGETVGAKRSQRRRTSRVAQSLGAQFPVMMESAPGSSILATKEGARDIDVGGGGARHEAFEVEDAANSPPCNAAARIICGRMTRLSIDDFHWALAQPGEFVCDLRHTARMRQPLTMTRGAFL